jgi:preprotein translocase subunit SecY
MTNAEREFPFSMLCGVVGRKNVGGQSTHIPLKVNMAGRYADNLCKLYCKLA